MLRAELPEPTPMFEVSPSQGLTIPASVLAKYGIQPGQKLMIIKYHGLLHLMPVISPEEALGSMPGLDTTIACEDDEE
jgi:hypothetical protein